MKRFSLAAIAWCCAAAGLTMVAGCGEPQTLAPATGKVLYRGKPLEFGLVQFMPQDGAKWSRGVFRSDGTFEMSSGRDGPGASVGLNRARVVCYEMQNPNDPKADEKRTGTEPFGKLLIPSRYAAFETSGLTADVRPGQNNAFEFELTD